MYGYTENRHDYSSRFAASGADPRHQVSAATRALHSVTLGRFEEHMGSCVVDAAPAGGTEADIKVEAADAIARLVRS